MGKLYAGIDLHSNNNYLCIIDESDKQLNDRKRFAREVNQSAMRSCFHGSGSFSKSRLAS